MKLLFDQNLSHRLVGQLADLFPGSVHVRELDAARASDREVWQLALSDDFIIVSKDDDFHHLGFLHGTPPKVIGIRLGNCSTITVAHLIRQHAEDIRRFAGDPVASFLPLP